MDTNSNENELVLTIETPSIADQAKAAGVGIAVTLVAYGAIYGVITGYSYVASKVQDRRIRKAMAKAEAAEASED